MCGDEKREKKGEGKRERRARGIERTKQVIVRERERREKEAESAPETAHIPLPQKQQHRSETLSDFRSSVIIIPPPCGEVHTATI